MKTIPILWQHDASRVVGYLEGDIITFLPRTVTKDSMTIGCGWKPLEEEAGDGGVTYITKARVIEFSVGE